MKTKLIGFWLLLIWLLPDKLAAQAEVVTFQKIVFSDTLDYEVYYTKCKYAFDSLCLFNCGKSQKVATDELFLFIDNSVDFIIPDSIRVNDRSRNDVNTFVVTPVVIEDLYKLEIKNQFQYYLTTYIGNQWEMGYQTNPTINISTNFTQSDKPNINYMGIDSIRGIWHDRSLTKPELEGFWLFRKETTETAQSDSDYQRLVVNLHYDYCKRLFKKAIWIETDEKPKNQNVRLQYIGLKIIREELLFYKRKKLSQSYLINYDNLKESTATYYEYDKKGQVRTIYVYKIAEVPSTRRVRRVVKRRLGTRSVDVSTK